MLHSSDGPLWRDYDVAMMDLDGVVYIGPDAVPGAPERLRAARDAGMKIAYVTNNASRPPSAVAGHLRDLGIELEDADVVTSAQAAARLLAERLPPDSAVFVLGGPGLEQALTERGLRPVASREEGPVAVASGFYADLAWSTVMTGAILVRDGLPWVASNTDATVPTPHGPGPGNGALVGVVARFAERSPVVAGKPEPPLFRETLERVGGSRPLVVGDRLDTDIWGAAQAGYDSLLVMTGVTDLAVLADAAPEQRPTYLAADLAALGRSTRAPSVSGDRVTSGPWQASVVDGRLEVVRRDEPESRRSDAGATGPTSDGSVVDGPGGDPSGSHEGDDVVDQWWQVVATAAWRHRDTHDRAPDLSGLSLPVA